MQFETIIYDVKDNIARITLNRPDANNAMNVQMTRDLCYAAMDTSENQLVRGILITGTGKTFCPGGDIKSFASAGENLPGILKEMTSYLHLAISRFTRGQAPVIVAVNGIAAGAGLSLACMGDMLLVAESARFTMAYTQIGLSPDGGATYFLPRLIGLRHTQELALTNRQLSAKEALNWGIATEVVPDSELMSRSNALVMQVAAGATTAFGATRRLIQSGLTENLETQMEFESQSIVEMSRTADAQNTISAFVQKRLAKKDIK